MADISEEEKQLLAAFKALNVKPKADTPEDLQHWLQGYAGTAKEQMPPITVSNHQPRLSIFYGDTTSLTKGEVTYDQWRYEVRSLLVENTYKKETILQAIRRSVRGEASKMLMRLGTDVTIETILEKFESVYGVVDTKESLLARFYSAKQRDDEDITTWSCRLEDILSQAVEKKIIRAADTNEMLRSMFWTGMRQDLKDISGYKFETVKDFDKFRVEIRKLEQDHLKKTEKQGSSLAISKSATDKNEIEKSDVQELKGMVKSLTHTVNKMDHRLNELEGTGFTSSNSGTTPVETVNDFQQFVPSSHNQYSDYRQPPYRKPRRFMSRRPNRNYTNAQPRQTDSRQENETFQGNCYKCGKRGHRQWNCRARGNPGKRLN